MAQGAQKNPEVPWEEPVRQPDDDVERLIERMEEEERRVRQESRGERLALIHKIGA